MYLPIANQEPNLIDRYGTVKSTLFKQKCCHYHYKESGLFMGISISRVPVPLLLHNYRKSRPFWLKIHMNKPPVICIE